MQGNADADEAGGSKLQDMYVQRQKDRQTVHVPCGCVSDLDRNFPAHALPCRRDLQAAIRKPQFVLYCPSGAEPAVPWVLAGGGAKPGGAQCHSPLMGRLAGLGSRTGARLGHALGTRRRRLWINGSGFRELVERR